jgi:hypothetical protein
MEKQDYATQEDIIAHADTRLNIIDEISFADYDCVLAKTSATLQAFTEQQQHQYEKSAIDFLSDLCQLEAIGNCCIYKHRHGIYWEETLNCVVDLKGMDRYKNCTQMKRSMSEMRERGLSEVDRLILNSRVIDGINVKMPSPLQTRNSPHI